MPSRLIQTSQGPLEYAVLGEGLPLVVMHGSGGGVRQGLLMRCLLDTRRIQIIALSRAGYWGTPLETAPEMRPARIIESPNSNDFSKLQFLSDAPRPIAGNV